MKIINIGIIGLGNVGGGVVKSLIEKKYMIFEKTGIHVNVLKVYDKMSKRYRELKISSGVAAKSVDEILNNPDIDIIVELVGGIHPAREIILKAIKNGKHIVTANKALLARNGSEIFKSAMDSGLDVGFEASVCGALPVIKALKESFAASRLNTLYGIVNGTSNYILTRMAMDNYSFSEAVREAQNKGIAERDPSLDIDGEDACHKLCILAMLGFGVDVKPQDIYVEGIRGIELQDINYARDWNYEVKLLAIAKRYDNKISLRVHPTLIPEQHLLSAVKYEYNAVFLVGDMIGDSMIYGKGAGRFPAASAVLSDILDISRNIILSGGKKKNVINKQNRAQGGKIADIGDLTARYYVRFQAIDRPGVLKGIASILAKNKISIATVSQKERKEGTVVPIIMLTHEANESSMNKALKEIDRMSFIKKRSVRIRIEK